METLEKVSLVVLPVSWDADGEMAGAVGRWEGLENCFFILFVHSECSYKTRILPADAVDVYKAEG